MFEIYNSADFEKAYTYTGIDIRTSTAREILTYLATPVNACRYCAEKPTEMKWEKV